MVICLIIGCVSKTAIRLKNSIVQDKYYRYSISKFSLGKECKTRSNLYPIFKEDIFIDSFVEFSTIDPNFEFWKIPIYDESFTKYNIDLEHRLYIVNFELKIGAMDTLIQRIELNKNTLDTSLITRFKLKSIGTNDSNSSWVLHDTSVLFFSGQKRLISVYNNSTRVYD